jgi:cell division protein FtsN
MAKSTSRQRGAVKPGSGRQIPGWVWLFTGVVTGLFIAFLYHLAQLQQETPGQASHDKPAADSPAGTESKKDKPRFDFYAVLPKMEVIIPKGDKDDAGDTPERDTGGNDRDLAHRNDENYLLQAGSFRTTADADRRRAELILQGYDVRIQAVELESGDSWHRVMVGPFNNTNALHRAQDKLAASGIETLPIKQKKNQADE